MGMCMSRCYTEVQRLSCWQIKSNVEDRDRLIDFDMFLDEQPRQRPVSMTTLLESELSSSDTSLLRESDTESENSDTLFQLGVDNEEMELQEESAVEASQEAMKLKQIAENSTELVNPARLAIESSLKLPLKEKYSVREKKLNGHEKESNTGIENGDCSTSSSPAELEWENEDGLSPVTHISRTGEISPSSDTASCASCSQLSTPVSNGNEELEWDGHFTSTHISQLDLETEHLISEIERLTSGVLEEQASNS